MDNKWLKVSPEVLDADKVQRPSLTFWQDAWARLKRNKIAMISMIYVLIVSILCIIVPMVSSFSIEEQKTDFGYFSRKYEGYVVEGNNGEKLHFTINSSYNLVPVEESGKYIGIKSLENNGELISKDEKLVENYSEYSFENFGDVKIDTSIKKLLDKELNELSRENRKLLKNDELTQEDNEKIDANNARIKEITKLIKEGNDYKVTHNGVEIQEDQKFKNIGHLWGTDSLGRDLFTRVMYGGRISLLIGLVVSIINLVIGVVYGGIAGYFGGAIDNIMMRIVDIIASVPRLLYVILFMVIFEPSIGVIILSIGITFWLRMARIVRGQILSLKEQEFILAARTLGASDMRILFQHLIPNTLGPVMVNLAMSIPAAIFTEAFLSFIGIGVQPPRASWGSLANDAMSGGALMRYPYLMFYPAMIMSITLLAFNLFSDGLRDSLDPRLRK